MTAALPLASVSDLEAALGRDLNETEKRRAEFVLDKLSAAFRDRARQTFTVEQYTHRLKVDGGGRLFPTRTPLLAVHSVTTDDGTPVAWQLRPLPSSVGSTSRRSPLTWTWATTSSSSTRTRSL